MLRVPQTRELAVLFFYLKEFVCIIDVGNQINLISINQKTMTKKLLFCTSLLMLCAFTYAQVQVSVTGGLHKTSITPSFLNYPDTSIGKGEIGTSGIEVGISAEIPITGKLYFRPGVIYSVKGSQWNQIYDTTNLVAKTKGFKKEDDRRIKVQSLNTTLHLAYIEIPLNIMFKTIIGAKTKFLIAGGPQFSLFYNGYTEENKIRVSQDSAQPVKTNFTTEKNADLPIGKLSGRYRTLHVGANALAGVDFGRVYFTLNYTNDLTEFYEEDGRKYKASTFGGSIGIYFGKQEKAKRSVKNKTKKK
jgi:hypothetical protein